MVTHFSLEYKKPMPLIADEHQAQTTDSVKRFYSKELSSLLFLYLLDVPVLFNPLLSCNFSSVFRCFVENDYMHKNLKSYIKLTIPVG